MDTDVTLNTNISIRRRPYRSAATPAMGATIMPPCCITNKAQPIIAAPMPSESFMNNGKNVFTNV